MPMQPPEPRPPILICKSQTGSKYPTPYRGPLALAQEADDRLRELHRASEELRQIARKPR